MLESARIFLVVAALSAIPLTLAAQSGKKPVKKTVTPPVAVDTKLRAVPETAATPEPIRKGSAKANPRPEKAVPAVNKNYVPSYFYTFDRPGFTYSHIAIEHDETGRGQVSMKREGNDEPWSDPIQLSPGTMGNLKRSFAALDFFDSKESYQYENDYSHLGNVTIRAKSAGKERSVKFNWTNNRDARALMDEYRRITNEYTWRFEMTSALENQQLLTPGLMETLDGYLQRNELSDPPHLIPLLKELSADERLPLMARNRATRMLERIQKAARKA